MKKFLIAVVVGIVAVVTSPGTAAHAAPGPTPYGFLQPLHDTTKCVDVPDFATANNVAIDQWTCIAQTNVSWRIEVPDADQPTHVWIRSQSSKKCLTVLGGSTAQSAPVVQYTCTTANNNGLWWVTKNHDSIHGTYWDFENVHSGKVLNIQGASHANGAKLIQYSWGAASWNNFFYFPTDLTPYAS